MCIRDRVKGYKKAGKDKMFLCNKSNRPVVVLEKKEADVKLSVLNGEWKKMCIRDSANLFTELVDKDTSCTCFADCTGQFTQSL